MLAGGIQSRLLCRLPGSANEITSQADTELREETGGNLFTPVVAPIWLLRGVEWHRYQEVDFTERLGEPRIAYEVGAEFQAEGFLTAEFEGIDGFPGAGPQTSSLASTRSGTSDQVEQ